MRHHHGLLRHHHLLLRHHHGLLRHHHLLLRHHHGLLRHHHPWLLLVGAHRVGIVTPASASRLSNVLRRGGGPRRTRWLPSSGCTPGGFLRPSLGCGHPTVIVAGIHLVVIVIIGMTAENSVVQAGDLQHAERKCEWVSRMGFEDGMDQGDTVIREGAGEPRRARTSPSTQVGASCSVSGCQPSPILPFLPFLLSLNYPLAHLQNAVVEVLHPGIVGLALGLSLRVCKRVPRI